MKKILLTSLLLHLFLLGSAQKCKRVYKELIAPGSKLIQCTGNTSLEKTKNGDFVFKRYYTGNFQITELITFDSRFLKNKDGLYQKFWDDGTLVEHGFYKNNERNGIWIEEEDLTGNYQVGKKVGVWRSYGADSILLAEYNYVNGLLEGEQLHYDSLGNVEYKDFYKAGEIYDSTAPKIGLLAEENPRFPGCENLGLDGDELDACAQKKMLEYMYGNLKYPREARNNDVTGRALVKFVVDKDGSITDIEVLNGVSPEIEQEVIRLLFKMPKWRPGYQNGKIVKVLYTLPITFMLN